MYKIKNKYKDWSIKLNGFIYKFTELTDKQIVDNQLTKYFTKLKKIEDKLIKND